MSKRKKDGRMNPKNFRTAVLNYAGGHSANQSGRDAGVSESTGQRWIGRMAELGLTAEQVEKMDDEELRKAVWKPMGPNPADRYPLDEEAVAMEVLNGVTIQQCFEEYQEKAAKDKREGLTTLEPIKRTQFHDRISEKLKTMKKTKRQMRTEAKTGDDMEIDVAGKPIKLPGPDGKYILAKVFVAVLRATKLLYAQVMPDGTTASWNKAIVGALKAFGGVPRHIVIDNDTALVKDATRGAQVYTQTFEDLCDFYGMDIAPARVGEPQDKGLVESSVRIFERQFICKIEPDSLKGLDDTQVLLRIKTEEINNQPMKVYGGSRRQDFEKRERYALKKLPEGEFTPYGAWKVKTIRDNGCVEFDGHYYLTDHNYPAKKIRVRLGPDKLLHFASMKESADLWTYRHHEKKEPDPVEGFNHAKPEFRAAWELTAEAQLVAATQRLGSIGENAGEYAATYVEKHRRKQKRATADQLNYLARKLEQVPSWAANLACEQAMAAGYIKNDIVLAYLKVIVENPNFRKTNFNKCSLAGACLRSPEEFSIASGVIFGKNAGAPSISVPGSAKNIDNAAVDATASDRGARP